jgi:hypothetical protein
VEAIKTHLPEVHIVWGGHLATGLRQRVFDLVPHVDAVVIAEGEQLLPLIVSSLRTRGAYPAHQRILVNPRISSLQAPIQVPSISLPDWTALYPVRVLSNAAYAATGARILTTMGCPYDCHFCTTPMFSSRRVTVRPLPHVLNEVRRLTSSNHVSRLWINDDLFVDGSPRSAQRAREFCHGLSSLPDSINFRPLCRSDAFDRDPELLRTMSAAGMDTIFVGIESGDDDSLAILGKRLHVAQSHSLAQRLQSLGVILQPGFIMFAPRCSISQIRTNVAFLASINELYRFFPLGRTALAYPGTVLWDTLEADDAIDHARSTHFVRYPALSPPIRELSVAFEQIEELMASIDGPLYRARADGRMSLALRKDATAILQHFALQCLDYAELGGAAEYMVRMSLTCRDAMASILERIPCRPILEEGR